MMTLVRGYRFAQPTATSRIIPLRGNRESAIRALRLRELGATGRSSAIGAWGLAPVFVKFDLKLML